MSYVLLPSRVHAPSTLPDSDDFYRLQWTRQPGREGTLHVSVTGAVPGAIAPARPIDTLPRWYTGSGPKTIVLRDYQTACVKAVLGAWERGSVAPVAIAPTGCHAAGQRVLLSTGESIAVEDVTVGTQLLGPDGLPRNVLQLCRGRGPLFLIIPTKGTPWTANADHILTLRRTRESATCTRSLAGTVTDVPLDTWSRWSRWYQHIHKLFRVRVDFFANPPASLPLDPYFLGVAIGDGCLTAAVTDVAIHKPDAEIMAACLAQGALFGERVRVSSPPDRCRSYHFSKHGPTAARLKALGLIPTYSSERFVPPEYKRADRSVRLALLAGLLDTDGHLEHSGYDYISKSPRLAADVAFLARSLGLAAYIQPCEKYSQDGVGGIYHRVSISGHADMLPLRIPRKQATTRQQKKDVLCTGFTVRALAEDEFFGFVLDGDHRYLLDDFTVTHNSGKTVIAAEIMRQTYLGRGSRSLFLAHRDELIEQTYEKVYLATSLSEHVPRIGIVKAKRDEGDRDITIASIATLSRAQRLQRLLAAGVPYDYVICDEAHHAVSTQWLRVLDALRESNPNVRILGLSVGPESRIVLRGGIFGHGFLDTIEAAWQLASSQCPTRVHLGYDIIDLDSVESRGWSGTRFLWKTCRQLIRHRTGTSVCREIITTGRVTTLLTDSHSVYRASADVGRCGITHTDASRLAPRDVLIGDPGTSWIDRPCDNTFDMLSFARQHMSAYRVYVACDTTSISRSDLRALGFSPQRVFDARSSRSLPLAVYDALPAPPAATGLHLRGIGYPCPTVVPLDILAYLFGVWLGDGWVDWARPSKGRGRIAFAVADDDVATFTSYLHSIPIPVGISVRVPSHEGASKEVRVSNAFLAAVFRAYFGRVTAATKRLPPECVIVWPDSVRRALLAGLVASDGSTARPSRDRVRRTYRTTNPRLAHDVLTLLLSLGIQGSLASQPPQRGGTLADGRVIEGRCISYTVHWSGHAEDGCNTGHRGLRSRFDHGALQFHERPVRAVTPLAQAPEYVYDVAMDGHPSFTVDGFLVHNTATPGRADGTALDRLFTEVCFERNLLDMIQLGYLVPPKAYQVTLDLDLDSVATTEDGDFAQPALSKLMNQPAVNRTVVESWRAYGQNRKTLVFAVDVAHSRALRDEFVDAGYPAEHVDGSTKAKDRKAILTRFRDGTTKILTNCNLATEGYDEPSIEAILMARPTHSQTLVIQAIGRGLRLFPGKTECVVIDCVGNTERHRLVQLASISGFDPLGATAGTTPAEPREFQEEQEAPAVTDATMHVEEVDLAARSARTRYQWRETTLGWVLWIPQIGYYLLAWADPPASRKCHIRFYDRRAGRENTPARDVVSSPIEFDLAFGLVESEMDRIFSARLRRGGDADTQGSSEPTPEISFVDLDEGMDEEVHVVEALVLSDAAWRTRTPSEKQFQLLRKLGVKTPLDTAGEASDLITILRVERDAKMRVPATRKQLGYLHVHGISFPPTLTKGGAATLIWQHRKRTEGAR